MRLFEYAGPGETLKNALIVMGITFAVLGALFLLVKAFTLMLGRFVRKPQPEPEVIEEEFSAGTLVLKDVDEATAAMIMAIVSDESGIPLERLIFRSIKLIEQGGAIG